METWLIITAIILVIVMVDIAAVLWGADSRYDARTKGWEWSRSWRSFAHK